MDMHSGGGRKTPFEYYFIEAANRLDAEIIFTEVTGEDPDDVACPCCGANFSFNGPYDTLEEASELWHPGQTLTEFINNKQSPVKVIPLTNPEVSI